MFARLLARLPGLIVPPSGRRPIGVVGFAVANGRIVEIDLVADPEKLGSVTLGE